MATSPGRIQARERRSEEWVEARPHGQAALAIVAPLPVADAFIDAGDETVASLAWKTQVSNGGVEEV